MGVIIYGKWDSFGGSETKKTEEELFLTGTIRLTESKIYKLKVLL